MSADFALLASALMMGLAGGPHCAAMCGTAYAAIGQQGRSRGVTRASWALHAGRVVSYSAAGGLVAASVSWMSALGAAAPVLRPLWSLVHVGGLSLGLWLLWQGRAPAWLSGAARPSGRWMSAQPVRFFANRSAATRAAVIGSCWAAMPCGLLQSALIVAALASGPLQGASVMAAFAVASALSLWLAPWLWFRLRGRIEPGAPSSVPVRGAGILLAGACGFALWHSVSAQVSQALCLTAGL